MLGGPQLDLATGSQLPRSADRRAAYAPRASRMHRHSRDALLPSSVPLNGATSLYH